MPWYQTRQVAKLIGVNESTVRENTAGFPAPGKKKDKKNNGTSVAGTGNPASPLSGAAAAKAVESKIVVAIADHHATTARVHPIGCAPHETHTFRSAPTTSVDAAPMNFPSWSGDVPTHRCVQVSTRVRNGHLVYTERVGGSNPSPPTSLRSASFGSARPIWPLCQRERRKPAPYTCKNARAALMPELGASPFAGAPAVPYPNIGCKAEDRFFDQAVLAARPPEIRCPYRQGIRLLSVLLHVFSKFTFSGMRKTIRMSLCSTDCWSRLSHLRVTPDQFFSVTVP
jgi:hypothetical protein